MFKRVLIANRGEIAVRIAQTLQQMGITAVAVYSEPDAGALHVQRADEAYPLGGASSAESYLRGDSILEIASRHGVEAIHPGYGFLSENSRFARACAEKNIVFIGPSEDAIEAMGDKILAKRTMRQAGVPVVPGWDGTADTGAEKLRAEADRIGYPLLVKAAAGGGGKGMRRVERAADLELALAAATREATNAFADGRIFLEKYVERPRHVEFQIFGDRHGRAVHLFERECSIQRRYQKIIEETPSPALTPALRKAMGDAAVNAARAIRYDNAGTVEFILDSSGGYYFLEVNTRLQVEHPVTEMTIHRDLVRAQVCVAAGERLPFEQATVRQMGHAIECRVYAEDPRRGFLPSVGRLSIFAPPSGPGIRVDTGFAQGDEVTTFYDPMLAKLIVWAEDRAAAIERMLWALSRFAVLGVTTNVEFLQEVVDHAAFRAGELHTHFLEEHGLTGGGSGAGQREDNVPDEAFIAAALTGGVNGASRVASREGSAMGQGGAGAAGPWERAGGWRNV